MTFQKTTLVWLGAVIAVQAVDAGLHIAINEVETLRIASNAVLVIGAIMGVVFIHSWRASLWAGAVVYVGLNLAFVALFGLENPVSGVNRSPLFGFMALSLWLTYRMAKSRAKAGVPSPV